MKKIFKFIFCFLLLLGFAIGCVNTNTSSSSSNETSSSSSGIVDYVSNFKLDMNSERKKLEVTVYSFIDGDTVHFNADSSFDKGIAKARFLGVNTPESTGQVEPWGKAASNFTKGILSNAVSIIIESESSAWEADSTGERYLLWVWYKTEANSDYRLLNLELLQEGYSIANNIGKYAYKDVLQGAFSQALELGLRVNGSEKDPNYDYGRPTPMTLRYIRENLTGENSVVDRRVSFEALITYVEGTTIYVEDYDEETEQAYGMTIFLGMSPTASVLQITKVGNIVDFCGVVTYSDGFGYQVSSITRMAFDPKYKYNSNLVSEGNEVKPNLIVGSDLIDNGSLLASTFVEMKDLVVTDTYTTKEGDNKGAITITCTTTDNKTITVRTGVLTDENGEVITEDVFEGTTIDVMGIVDYYNNAYQVLVHKYTNIDIH